MESLLSCCRRRDAPHLPCTKTRCPPEQAGRGELAGKPAKRARLYQVGGNAATFLAGGKADGFAWNAGGSWSTQDFILP
jgi:hypothetical protein